MADGDITVDLRAVTVERNDGEGIQIEEAGEGDVELDARKVTATGNAKEGLQAEELGAGDATAKLRAITASGNEDNGIEVTQEQGDTEGGNVEVSVYGSTATANDKDGLKVESDDTGTLKVRGSNIDAIDTDVDEI